MTRALGEAGAKVFAIERDENLCRYLKKIFSGWTKIEIITGNATHFPWETLADAENPVILVGNLPYNISTQILRHLLLRTHLFKRWQFMFQKEVAERICAKPGERSYGALSVYVQSVTSPALLKVFPPNYFIPHPKVDSALVTFEMLRARKSNPMHNRYFVQIVKAAFSHRRKMLRNNLKILTDGNMERLTELLETAGIEGVQRAQNLTVEDYLHLAKAASSHG